MVLSGFANGGAWWEVFAGEFVDDGRPPGILQTLLDIPGCLRNPGVLRAGLAVTGAVVLVGQAGFRVLKPARQRFALRRSAPGCLGRRTGTGGHQNTNQKMTSANAGTPSSQAKRYFPMRFLLQVVEKAVWLKGSFPFAIPA